MTCPICVIPGVLNMADEDNMPELEPITDEMLDERDRRRSITRAKDAKFAELTPQLMRIFGEESKAHYLEQKKADKEYELKGIQVRKNVANRMHKDFSKNGMFDM